jgi:hypothetical protein
LVGLTPAKCLHLDATRGGKASRVEKNDIVTGAIHGCQGLMRVIKDFPCFHVPMPWSRLALGEAGREMSRGTIFWKRLRNWDCNAARLPRHTLTLA